MRLGLIAVAGAVLGGWASLAFAQEPGKTVSPDWLRKPSSEDLRAVWPTKAYEAGRGGEALLGCDVTVNGALANCTAVSEKPAGMGFGAAAIALTPQFLFRPAMRDGKPVVVRVFIPINFSVAGGGGGLPAPGRIHLSQVHWSAAPSYADVIAAYPEKARAAAAGGHAALSCQFAAAGRLGKCDVLREDPSGMGFAKAAQKLVDRFVGPATLPDGKSTRGAVTDLIFTFDPALLTGVLAVSKPAWERLPTGEETDALLPKTPIAVDVSVRVACTVAEAGALKDCQVESEAPAGQGFGQMAVAMTGYMRLSVWTDDGLPSIGGRIVAPIRYHTQAVAAEPAKPAP